jgi:excisionase family DNA binding protein
MGELLKVSEVAARLRCSQSMIYKLVSRGVLKCVRIGRGLRFDEGDIIAYIAAAKEGGHR